MAGIGFRLTKYFSGKNVWDNLKGTLYSTVISSGPWLISVLSVFFVGLYAQHGLNRHDLYVFKCIISYTFAASLLLFGAFEMPLTRYLADKLYMADISTFRGVFINIVTIAVITSGTLGYFFYAFFDWGIILRMICVGLLAAILIVWSSMIFLSASKNYVKIVISFLIGGASSFVFSIVLGKQFALIGYIGGYALGQILTAILLAQNVFSEYSDFEYFSLEYLTYFSKYKKLIFVGMFYYLGIWVDKFIFWYSEVGDHVEGLFYTNQYYDTAMFLSYLTIVPSFAVFMVQVETDFYIKYTYFYRAIEDKYNLKFLENGIEEITISLKKTIVNLIKIQTFVSVICWYFSQEIVELLYLPSLMEPVFKYGVIGAFLQILFLISNIVLLYFEERKPVLINYLIFLISNLVLSGITVEMGVRYHGLGYVVSSLLTLISSFYFLNETLKNINYKTFMSQKMTSENFITN